MRVCYFKVCPFLIKVDKSGYSMETTMSLSEIAFCRCSSLKTSSFNTLGTKVFGTHNPEVTSGNRDDYKKEIVIYNLDQNSVSRITSKGYPLYIKEDNQGRIVSISSGFPRDEYYDIHNDNVPDMFVEIIED